MAILLQLAIEAGARKASFAECRDYLWTRLIGSRRTIDVLFRTPNRCNDAEGRNICSNFSQKIRFRARTIGVNCR
jgi:hypothetical protein